MNDYLPISREDIKKRGWDTFDFLYIIGDAYVDHGIGAYPMSASGDPFSAATLQVTSDPITDLSENMGAEQKARATYEYLMDLCDDYDVLEPLKFLREREVIHFQRFGEALDKIQQSMTEKNKFYMSK